MKIKFVQVSTILYHSRIYLTAVDINGQLWEANRSLEGTDGFADVVWNKVQMPRED